MAAQRIYVSGKVQGVGYRDWLIRRAQEMGVIGWVRNLRDGRVEVLAMGDDATLARLAELCRSGPSQARVEAVDAQPDQGQAVKGFTKRFTA